MTDTSPIIIECPQGSDIWYQARIATATASMFHVAIDRVGGLTAQQQAYVNAILRGEPQKAAMELAGYKAAPKAEGVERAIRGEKVGDFSEACKNYAFTTAIEKISGKRLDGGFETWQMRRGHELEPMARMEHEIQAGVTVKRAGFVKMYDGLFGCSADGFIGDDEGCEYKCFLAPEKLRAFWIDNDADSIKPQVQGCLWITGRKRWHIGMYCPDLEPCGKQLWLQVVERDEAYIAQLEASLMEFKGLVDFYESKLRA